eukprot:13637173-Alexandrium_andersonii.AAC.1
MRAWKDCDKRARTKAVCMRCSVARCTCPEYIALIDLGSLPCAAHSALRPAYGLCQGAMGQHRGPQKQQKQESGTD